MSTAATPAAPAPEERHDTLPRLRRLLLALLLAGVLGTGAELVLLDHTEHTSQWVPIVALGAGGGCAVLVLLRPRRAALRAFQTLMGLFMAAGVAGLFLHYKGNAEFELERQPSLRGLELFWKSIDKGATPALAPLSMLHLGLLGLASTYRHPSLGRRPSSPARSTEET